MLTTLLEVLVPASCVACRGPGEVARGDPLCAPCRLSLPWLDPRRRCERCGLPERCPPRRCPARRQAFAAAWSPLAYAAAVPSLVIALKDHGALRVATTMAAHLASAAPPGIWDDGTLVPVPADPLRRRRRGVDHAARIASELGPRVGLPIAHVLARERAPAHARLSRRARLGDEVGVRTRGAVPLRTILVDDVHTTGATLHACALALREAGADRVTAVTYARTLT
jgi:predicted amidophosphoribosyltransferase